LSEAVTEAKQRPGKQSVKPTQPMSGYVRNPLGRRNLSIFMALLARTSKISNCSSAAFMGFNQRFLNLKGPEKGGSLHSF